MTESKHGVNGAPEIVEKLAESGDQTPQTTSSLPENSNAIVEDQSKLEQPSKLGRWRRLYDVVFWTPPNCRWDREKPPKFSMALNVLFAFAGAFTVANLYYNHPILNVLARDFGVPYAKVAQIPTVAQAGYAVGLFFLCPLGDLFERRPFVLTLVLFTATMSIGLCTVSSLAAFSAIQFVVGVTTVTPQLMLPLVGDLAPPRKRAQALSVVVSGFVMGILVARLLSGIVTQYTSWRNVYWMSVGLQYTIFISLWMFMPDYPATNKNLNYFKMLWSMIIMLTKHPVLVQACLISYFTSATFTSFWTVLTFLLAGPPYHFDPVIIGLFALIGIGAMFGMPLYAKTIIDRFVPWFSVVLGMTWCMIGICVGAYAGEHTVAGPIIQAFLLDLGMQSAQIANRSSIYTIEPKGRNRINTCFMVFTFFGQLTGTSVGAQLYARAGWVGSQSFSVGCIFVALLINFTRGPWEEGWIGWHGGLSIWKKDKSSADGKRVEEKNSLRRLSTNEERPQINIENIDLEKNTADQSRDIEHGDERNPRIDGSGSSKDGIDEEKASSQSGDDGITPLARTQT